MTWLLLVAFAWTAFALPVGLLLGRAMRVADRRDDAARLESRVPDFIPAEVFVAVAAQQRRY
ncbi:hypothetical protein ACI78T_06645 [Blastococcus sp. SYSU D00922]